MKRGDLWWVEFDPSVGSEIQKIRGFSRVLTAFRPDHDYTIPNIRDTDFWYCLSVPIIERRNVGQRNAVARPTQLGFQLIPVPEGV
jgi:hypothetical protein